MEPSARQWPSHEAWVKYNLAEGFRVGACKCRECHHVWQAAVHPETVAWKLECPRCHRQNNWFTETAPLKNA